MRHEAPLDHMENGLATADLDFELPWNDASMDEQQMNRDDKIMFRRRSFLRLLAAGGSAAAASMAPLGGPAVADTLSYDERREPLYRETEEVKTFYRVNRYPARGRR
jgi:hypothetical protein